MARTYEMDVEVAADGTLHPTADQTLPPGRYHAVMTEEQGNPLGLAGLEAETLFEDGPPLIEGWPWPAGFTFKRSEIYEDEH